MDMEPKSWVRAQEVIRRSAQNMVLKPYPVGHRPMGLGHVMNSMSEGHRSRNQSPGKQRKKYIKENRGRDKPRGDSSQGKQQKLQQHKTLL